jgi:hypothetical protein
MPVMHWAPAGHAMSQPPQLFGSLVGSTQTLLQRICVPGHTILLQVWAVQHPPPWHEVVPAGHVSPQPPQLSMSVFVSTHVVPQHVRPTGQGVFWQFVVFGWQTPSEHVSFAPQTLPHVPQLLGSVSRFASQPSATWWSQSAKPTEHAAIAQAEETQSVVPFGTGPHTTPHAPQLLSSDESTAHWTPLQHVWPEGHVWLAPHGPTHTPPEQLSFEPHATPQPPQFAGSVLVFTSQPSDTWWSQSAKPGVHPPSAHAPVLHVATAFA